MDKNIRYQQNLEHRKIAIVVLEAYVQAGAGIVADSVPESEYQECMNKTRALVRAVELARSGE